MITNLKGKKVTVMGLGLHGGGVASVKWLVNQGALVTVTDLKSKVELQSAIEKLKGVKVKYVLDKHTEADFKKTDLIVQNPGVPTNSNYLKIAEKAGVLLENDASLFFKHCKGEIIGVTGTRGKSTTVSLIYQLLKKSKKQVWLAGLSQKPMLEIVDRVKSGDIVVLELSSWQLEILGRKKLSPKISVITNIFPDHLNRYRDMKMYIKAKKNIILNQKKESLVILNLDNFETKKMGKEVIGQRFWFSSEYFDQQNGCYIKSNSIFYRLNGREIKLSNIKDIELIGKHNLENILAALTVAGIYKIKPINIKKVLFNFRGLPGRLELIKKIKGVNYINDTTATIPDATVAALHTLSLKFKAKSPKVILIAGGTSKNIPDLKYNQLAKIVKKKCKAVILLPGKGSKQLVKALKKVKFNNLYLETSNMKNALTLAKSNVKTGDIVLLSPACASFGIFVNEFDRGDQFNKIVQQMK